MAHRPTPVADAMSNSSLNDEKDISTEVKHTTTLAEDGERPSSTSRAFNGHHVYEDKDLAKYFAPIPEYEGAHRFDPKATWTEAEERKLVRKVDLRIMVCACVMYFALQLDRGNLSAALSDNMLDDLNLTTVDLNNGKTIFYVSFMCAELPSQLVSKRLGPDVWLPIQLICWSIVAMAQCRLSGRASFFVTRSLLGLLEGGFTPDMILFLSYFYTGVELTVRLSFFWAAMTLTNISGSLLGFGILRMRGLHGWAGWQYLFLIEGAVTLAIGIFSFFWLPASPTQTKGILRGKNGWFTEREEVIMVNRILRDDPTKGDMHNRQALRLSDFWASVTDYDNWGIYLIGLCAWIPEEPPSTYLTLTLKSLGFSTLNTNLLTIPTKVLFIINNLLLAQLSRITGERAWVASISNLWMIPMFAALIALPDDTSPWVRFALLTLLLAYPYANPIVVAWNSTNSGSVRTRTVSAALQNICVQGGNIIGSQIYFPGDKPYYRRGNSAVLGICVWNVLLFSAVKFYYIQRNKWKAARWNAMTTQQKAQYLEDAADKGNKRLDFVFVH